MTKVQFLDELTLLQQELEQASARLLHLKHNLIVTPVLASTGVVLEEFAARLQLLMDDVDTLYDRVELEEQ